MAKTRKKKRNRSPGRPYRNSRAYTLNAGDLITTRGVRGRTKVTRITDEEGKRIGRARLVEAAKQPPPPSRPGAKRIRVGGAYVGMPRSKAYPYGSTRQGFPAPVDMAPKGLLGRAAKAMKTVKTKMQRKAAGYGASA